MEQRESDAEVASPYSEKSGLRFLFRSWGRRFQERPEAVVQEQQPVPSVSEFPAPEPFLVHAESPRRLTYLEGLRGCASLMVLFHHLMLTFLPPAGFMSTNYNWASLGPVRWFILSPLAGLWDGPLAVKIFFIHSGLVLGYRFFRSGRVRDDIVLSALGRYVRLTIPMAASIFLAYFLLVNGLMWNREATPLTGSQSWLGSSYLMTPSFIEAFRQAFWSSYFNYQFSTSYNSNLWTIRAELIGSFFVYAFLMLFGHLKVRPLFYSVAAIWLWDTDILGFVIGMALCDLYFAFEIYRVQITKLSTKFAAFAALLTGIYLGAYRRNLPPYYDWLQVLDAVQASIVVKLLGAALIIASLMFFPLGQRFFNLRPIQYLGKISYALYLVHIPLICSLGSYSFLRLRIDLQLAYLPASLLASLLVIIVSIGLAHVLWQRADIPGIVLGKKVARWMYTR